MLKDCFESILIKQYHGYSVYFHNSSNFDINFFFNTFTELGKVTPIFRNGQLISLIVKYGRHYISFHDSYLLLLSYLDKLSQSFALEQGKTIFPYSRFALVEAPFLNYIGPVPVAYALRIF